MLNSGSRALGDVFPSDRELEHAVETLNLPVNGRSFDGSLWVPLRWPAAAMIAIFLIHSSVDLRQLAVSKVPP
jgi:hypothetical protein